MNAKICLAEAIMLLLCAADVVAASDVSIHVNTPKKQFEKRNVILQYTGSLSCSPTATGPMDVQMVAYFLFHDSGDKTLKPGVVDVGARQAIGSFSLDPKAQNKQAFKFSSPKLAASTVGNLKGVLVCAISAGDLLGARSQPSNATWVKAARQLILLPSGDGEGNGGAGDVVANGFDSPSTSTKLDSGYTYAEKTGIVKTNIFLNTEWQFDQRKCGSTQALINDVVKCPRHSTLHIIDYNVVSDSGMDVYGNDIGCVDFTMSIQSSGNSKCIFRCWDRNFQKFDMAPPNHRASVAGDTKTVAEFRLETDTTTGEWKLLPLVTVSLSGYRIDARGNVLSGTMGGANVR